MKIIDNRYKIDQNIYNDFFVDAYKVEDLWKNNNVKFMKIYHYNLQRDLIDFFTNNQIKISNFKHKNILHSEEFKLVNTIDTKSTNMVMYYSISEYIEYTTLREKNESLELEEKIKILIDIILALDFLHFRGYTYKFLNPIQIAVTEDNTVKLQDLAAVIEKTFINKYTEFERRFISPDFIANNRNEDKTIDYYSLAQVIKYIFFESEKTLSELDEDYKKVQVIEFFNSLISDLEKQSFKLEKVNLIDLADKIIDFFDLDYQYDLVKERDNLFFENKIVGRDREISKLIKLDSSVFKKMNLSNVVLINGEYGVGKTRFLREISFRLKLRNRSVYSSEVKKDIDNEMIDASNLLRQLMNDTPNDLREKYRGEFSTILPELRLSSENQRDLDIKNKAEKYRIYNRIANYLKELSYSKTIYLLLDDIHNCNEEFINLIDYLVNNLRNNSIIFVLSYEEFDIVEAKNIRTKINSWTSNLNALEIKLHNLDLEEIGEIVKNIIGIAYVPLELSSILFKESQGNPKRIEEIFNYLYNIGQFFMSSDGKWKLKIEDYSDIYIPTKIDDIMVKQLNIIQEKYYEIVKTMSTFEDLLHKSILIKMLGIDGEELETLLEELINMKIIEEKLVDWGYSYSINSSELKKLIYFEIPQKEKIAIHKKAASIIEKFDGELYDSLFEELLYQLIRSNQKHTALKIILDKVDRLENKCGAQAKYLLDKAYNMVIKDTNSSIKIQILEKIIDISMLKSELDEDDPYLVEYANLSKSLESKEHILNHKRIMSEIHLQKGRIDLCEKTIKEIDNINKYENLERFKLYSLTTTALISIQRGNLNDAKDKLFEAKALAERLNKYDYLGNIYNRMGVLENLNGNQNIAGEYYKKSYECFIKGKNIIESVKPVNNLGNIYADHLNDTEKAIEYYKKGLEISGKYGIKKAQIPFLINISEINLNNYQYEKALKYTLEAKAISAELQDINSIIVSQAILGKIYLEMNKFEKAYGCFSYIKTAFEDSNIQDMEVSLYYYDFLGSFYLCMGDWDKAIENEEIAKELASKFNLKQYFRSKFKIILIDFFKSNKFNKISLNKFISEYKSLHYVEDLRKVLLVLTILNIAKGDEVYALKFLDCDNEIKNKVDIEFLNEIRSMAIDLLSPGQDNTDKLIRIEKKFRNEPFLFKTTLSLLIASRFAKENKNKDAIKYYIQALDNIYKNMNEIPAWDLKIGFIKSRNADYIKKNITIILEETYGKKVHFLKIDRIKRKEDFRMLNAYFDLNSIIEAIGKEEFSQITKIHSYGEALSIEGIESLLDMLKDDYKYNLNLILNYLSKETFATNAFILELNGESDSYNPIASLNETTKIQINDNIFKIANRTEKGLLITNNLDKSVRNLYRNCMPQNITAMICVPIDINIIRQNVRRERRKYTNNDNGIVGYIYLETDRVFNKFSEDSIRLIESVLYLIYINLENNQLKLIATTDKLTKTYTRKYYEQLFKELIESKKINDYGFSILMIDLDNFKAVNDTYRHQKGDEVLKYIGKTIKSSVRSSDIVARYGGEEFVVILKDAGENEALMIAEKIRKNAEDLRIKGLKNPITLSIGVSIYPNHSKFKEDLIEKADQALYYSKETGKNKVCLWNYQMGDSFERVDKLAGILTGKSEVDNKNVLGFIQIIQLIEEKNSLKEKIYKFLGELLNVIDAETASIIILDKSKEKDYTRVKSNENFAQKPIMNKKIIERVLKNRKGEFLIDWDNLEDVDSITGMPNWQSLIVLPMIKDGEAKGITYISVPLKKKEFDFNAFNLAKNYTSIFTSLL